MKAANRYTKLFVAAMKEIGRSDSEILGETFKTKYLAYLNSKEFDEFSRYKTISLEKVYCAITHAKICLELGYSQEEAQRIWEEVLTKKFKKLYRGICSFVDLLPGGYKIVAGLLYKDAKERIAEDCLTYEKLMYTDQKLEYIITRCAYVEIFEYYGIRQFCKVFCNSDLCMEVLHKRAKFVRHFDLVDGPYCHDEIRNIKYESKQVQKQ